MHVKDEKLAATKHESTPQGVKLPEIPMLRNGAQSTSFEPETPNSWGGTHDTSGRSRVVIRILSDPTSVLSLPAHGQNVQGEKEVILTGRGWKQWDAWVDKAPKTVIKYAA